MNRKDKLRKRYKAKQHVKHQKDRKTEALKHAMESEDETEIRETMLEHGYVPFLGGWKLLSKERREKVDKTVAKGES